MYYFFHTFPHRVLEAPKTSLGKGVLDPPHCGFVMFIQDLRPRSFRESPSKLFLGGSHGRGELHSGRDLCCCFLAAVWCDSALFHFQFGVLCVGNNGDVDNANNNNCNKECNILIMMELMR